MRRYLENDALMIEFAEDQMFVIRPIRKMGPPTLKPGVLEIGTWIQFGMDSQQLASRSDRAHMSFGNIPVGIVEISIELCLDVGDEELGFPNARPRCALTRSQIPAKLEVASAVTGLVRIRTAASPTPGHLQRGLPLRRHGSHQIIDDVCRAGCAA